MKKFSWFLTLVLVLFFAVACGDSKKDDEKEKNDTDEISDDDAEPAEVDENTETPDEEEPAKESLKCEDFAEGLNENLIIGEGKDELERSFYLRLPEGIDSDKKFPVIFLYHGFGDTAKNFERFLSGYVNNETMPFILVVPESRSDIFAFDNIPPKGIEWDMMNLNDGSAEIDMFDAVLACLEKKWKIDEKHIHVSGFSAGAIIANSVGVQRPDKVASILSYSGAYFSDKTSRDALGEIMGMKVGDFFGWPDFAAEHNKYPQVFVHGDKEEDSWGVGGMFTIYFNQMARLGAGYLTGMGHDAILCNHGRDHDVAGISEDSVIKFFADHPFGTVTSPYRDNLKGEFAEICHFFTEEDLVEEEEPTEENDTDEPADSEETPDEEVSDSEPEDNNPAEYPDEHPCLWRNCN